MNSERKLNVKNINSWDSKNMEVLSLADAFNPGSLQS